ncbi:hypothetical protein DV515_00015782 [Chloebia gouldiae]|uniref:Uncharacterized protein n=1 Tax=Chloebia gouldiae TaxID=44316 RepID=A0A3L8RU88_CHLGU|nr:hypothetical protein DV515_00015782 [Chloebia gouldiae]
MKGVETPGGQKAPEQMMKLNEILGKRRVCSPNSSSECPLESKKARSESPKETSQTPLLEEVAQMTPEEHYRRMMSALNEHGAFEEQQQQRLYQLANSMAVPSHGGRAGHGDGLCCHGDGLGDGPELWSSLGWAREMSLNPGVLWDEAGRCSLSPGVLWDGPGGCSLSPGVLWDEAGRCP